MWGATFVGGYINQKADVSIHAPRVGRDCICSFFKRITTSFNPRAPCGARRHCDCHCTGATCFNPRAPCGARHSAYHDKTAKCAVSIHAPRVGRDCGSCCGRPDNRCFNPRAPCGARPRAEYAQLSKAAFQSTRPVWGATTYYGGSAFVGLFQSTRPVWGATNVDYEGVISLKFQSTRPVWGATS